MTAVGPAPQTLEPTVGLVAVGLWTMGPTPQVMPLTGWLGEKNAEKSVGAKACGTLCAGDRSGFQTTGRIARAMRFQSGVMWNGTTGSNSRMFCVPSCGPKPKLV